VTLRQRVTSAFSHPDIGFMWPADDSAAVSHGGAVLQCEHDNDATLLCVLAHRDEQMLRTHAYWLVLLCVVAGWPQSKSEPWVTTELRAARTGARKSARIVAGLRLTLSIDHPPRTVMLHVEEALR
jgi:hypothetical protein